MALLPLFWAKAINNHECGEKAVCKVLTLRGADRMFPALSMGVDGQHSAFHRETRMSKPEPPSKEEFRARLEKAQQQQEQASWNRSDLKVERNSTAGRAWRLSVEMVAALLVCGWVGWLLDKWLDTKPWLMLVFLIVGAVVGLYNVIKVGKRMNDSANEE